MAATGTMMPLYAMMGTSAISSIGTGYSQSQALKSTGRYQSQIANTNAAMADFAGKETLEAGDIAAGNKNLETQQKVGAVRAAQGASGVDVGSGSAALVRGGLNLVGATDELTIRNNAARRAFGYKVEAESDIYQGKFAELTAKSEAEQSLINGGLGAISSPLAIYSNYKFLQRRMGVGGNSSIPASYMSEANT